jgi:hypothetical protein
MNTGLIRDSWLRDVGFPRDIQNLPTRVLTGIATLLIVQVFTGFAEANGSTHPATVDSIDRMGLVVVLGFFVLLILLVIGVGVMSSTSLDVGKRRRHGISQDGGQTYRELMRQEYNFSPPGTTLEHEEWSIKADAISHLQLTIKPDKGGQAGRATLTTLALE